MANRFLIVVAISFVLNAGCAVRRPAGYAGRTVNNDPIVLSGNDSMEITDAHYRQNNGITLRDNATLRIRRSVFEHRHGHSFQYQLRAYDNASVVIEDSEISSSPWLNWYFRGNSSLVLDRVSNSGSSIWHIFHDRARAEVRHAEAFGATMNDNVAFDIADSRGVFIELVYPRWATVDEAFPRSATDYVFPNEGERGIHTKLRMKNSAAVSWGITVNPGNDVTIRDTHSLVVTFHVASPYENRTAEFSNLRVGQQEDQSWQVVDADTRLRLINTKTERWSPIVSGTNTLIVKNSEIADNAFSFGDAKVVYEDCLIWFLHGNGRVHMVIRDSVVEGDVIATANSTIELINTKVHGQMVEKGKGKIVVR